MSATSFAKRFNDNAAGLGAVLRQPWGADWKNTHQELLEKIAEVSNRRENLIVERSSAVIAYVAGDPASGVKADELETAVAAADRELSRLCIARDAASEHVRIENQAAAAAAERDRVAAIHRKTRELRALAEKADEKIDQLRTSLGKLMDAWRELSPIVGNQEFDDARRRFVTLAPFLTNDTLHGVIASFQRMGFQLPAAQMSFAGNVPEAEWAASLRVPKA